MMKTRLYNSGFTIIEVITVLIMVGIIGAVVLSRFTSTATYSVVSEAEILKNHLRFAQLKAMQDLNSWGINVTSDRYTLQYNGANSTTNLPGESGPTHTFQRVSAATAQTVTFDIWGSPGTANKTITLTSGSDTASITVTKNTGFIP